MGYGYGWLDSGILRYRRQAYSQWNTGGGMHCAVISREHSYYWKTADCSTLANFICRKDPPGTVSLYRFTSSLSDLSIDNVF